MSRTLSIWASLLAALIIATSIYGGHHFFSPIPYWDQWDGELGFYKDVVEGNYSAFWSQHMEHRIVFSRVLFWLDIVLFGGRNVFTIIANYVLLAAVALVLWREYRSGHKELHPPLFIGGLIVGFLLLWVQAENIKWGFQSQCIAVYLFALMAFAQFSRLDSRPLRISLAMLFCVASMLSMGNGVVAFGVMAIQGVLQRRPVRESLIVAAGGAVCAFIYFHGYNKPILPIDPAAAHTSLIRLKFFAAFMGNPTFFGWNTIVAMIPPNPTGLATWGLKISALFGIASLAIAAIVTVRLFAKAQITPYRSFLIASYGLVVASAMGASNSRWMLGLEASVAGRYTTPVVISFAVLALLVLDVVSTRRARLLASVAPLALLTFIALYQSQAFEDNSYLFKWKLAVLGQKIGLDHPEYDATVYPAAMHDGFVTTANFAADYEIGPYGRGWLRDAGVVKFDAARLDQSFCLGHLDATSTDKGVMHATGWATTADRETLLIVLTDAEGKTIGYGVSGQRRLDVSEAVKNASPDAGWTGFANATQGPISAYVYQHGRFCKLP
ncbi:hypothetical protein [Paraburkholderia caffeinilytica]|uniref:hypothetical protein n=1 Tax=Paraburkholderia caffeinilytica TaxID=1761016 RepID=UPI003DA06889